jgi:hypothetical protein
MADSPVYPLIWTPATFRGRYRHMAKRDGAVWEKFLALYGEKFDAFSYDVALGGIVHDIPGQTPEDAIGYQYSTALKIDAVGRTEGSYWIIEVRPEATVSAIGSAITYAMVCERDEVFDGPLVPTVVCNSMQIDCYWAAAQLGIQVIQVPVL